MSHVLISLANGHCPRISPYNCTHSCIGHESHLPRSQLVSTSAFAVGQMSWHSALSLMELLQRPLPVQHASIDLQVSIHVETSWNITDPQEPAWSGNWAGSIVKQHSRRDTGIWPC